MMKETIRAYFEANTSLHLEEVIAEITEVYNEVEAERIEAVVAELKRVAEQSGFDLYGLMEEVMKPAPAAKPKKPAGRTNTKRDPEVYLYKGAYYNVNTREGKAHLLQALKEDGHVSPTGRVDKKKFKVDLADVPATVRDRLDEAVVMANE